MIKDKTIYPVWNQKLHDGVMSYLNNMMFGDVDGVVYALPPSDNAPPSLANKERATIKIDGCVGWVYRIEMEVEYNGDNGADVYDIEDFTSEVYSITKEWV